VQACVLIPEPALDKTEQLLEQILIPILRNDARVRFLCPSGEGGPIAQRVRVMLSRKRKALEQKGRRRSGSVYIRRFMPRLMRVGGMIALSCGARSVSYIL
jgi:hypothetical protein